MKHEDTASCSGGPTRSARQRGRLMPPATSSMRGAGWGRSSETEAARWRRCVVSPRSRVSFLGDSSRRGTSTTGHRGRGQEPQGPCGRGGGARPRLSADGRTGGTWAVRRLRGCNRLAPLGSDALLGRRAALPIDWSGASRVAVPSHEGDGLAAAFRRARAGRPVCRGADRHRRRSPRSLGRCRKCRRDLPGGDDDRHLRRRRAGSLGYGKLGLCASAA